MGVPLTESGKWAWVLSLGMLPWCSALSAPMATLTDSAARVVQVEEFSLLLFLYTSLGGELLRIENAGTCLDVY